MTVSSQGWMRHALLTPRQMLKFGELYLHQGRNGDRQVVPSSWVEASWTPRTRSLRSGHEYGYGWWITELAGHPVEFAWGFGGQYIFVVPSLDLVVVTTSSIALGTRIPASVTIRAPGNDI